VEPHQLTESALFFLDFYNAYRDLKHAKATSGVLEAWFKQDKAITAVHRWRLITEDSNDDATASKATSSGASKPSKERIINSGIAVVARAQGLPSQQSLRRQHQAS